MEFFKNETGAPVLLAMVKAIKENKAFLGQVDGLIGDGDHGVNMNKGFSLFEERFGGGGQCIHQRLIAHPGVNNSIQPLQSGGKASGKAA